MRQSSLISLAILCLFWLAAAPAQTADGKAAAAMRKGQPTDPRAQQTFEEGLELLKKQSPFAMDAFRKADKQDGNHCAACADRVLTLAIEKRDFKAADEAARELIALATTPSEQSAAHLGRAQMLMAMGKAKKKPDCYAEGQKEIEGVLTMMPGDHQAMYLKGVCLADQEQDAAAKQVFASLVPMLRPGSTDFHRVSRYAERPDLVRARMAPAFSVTTLDGRHLSIDELRDKVVLIDFWATWCGPCREALPNIQKIARDFEGQPFVVLSVSLDTDEAKWKEFVTKNNMTWLQVRDEGGWNGKMAGLFEVKAIPHTFSIDSDGVLQDEHVGEGSIEGKLKKLVAQAKQRQEKLPEHRQLEASETVTPIGDR